LDCMLSAAADGVFNDFADVVGWYRCLLVEGLGA
jgi:hypothetical protein